LRTDFSIFGDLLVGGLGTEGGFSAVVAFLREVVDDLE
jgi:hypothetical protein